MRRLQWYKRGAAYGAIVGSIAEARFGIPQEMKEKAISYLPDDMKDVVKIISCT